MATEFKIGVDGGASRTRAILVDPSGAIVAAEEAGGSNPNALAADEASAVCGRLVAELRRRARARRGRVVRTLLCMAGAREHWRAYGRGLRGCGRVTVGDDSLPVLELATAGKPGVVLHAGTGSFVAARSPGGAVSYDGGLGWQYGDEGGGYDLGRRAVAAALLEAQRGRAAPGAVGALVRRHAGVRTRADLGRFYRSSAATPPFVAGLAGPLLGLAERGDEGARRLVLDSAGALLALGTQVAARLFPMRTTVALGLSGPILTHAVVAPALEALSTYPLYQVPGPPIEGVRRLLARTRSGRT